MFKKLLRTLLTLVYRVTFTGLENYKAAGERVLIVANHLSFLDAALLTLYLPGKAMFAIDSNIAQRRLLQPVLRFVQVFPLDPIKPMGTKSIIRAIRKNERCIIFPEGRITRTGALMKIYEGPGMIADKSNATILPIRIDGAQYSPFSYLKNKVKIRWFPKITLTCLPPQTLQLPDSLKGRARRHRAALQLYDIMSHMLFDSTDIDKTLFQSLLEQVKTHGRKHLIAEDRKRTRD